MRAYMGEAERELGETVTPSKEGDAPFSALQLHFLRRLSRLLRLRHEQSGRFNSEGLHLIDRAIYSTYCDAVDLGVAAEAQKLLYRFPVPSMKQ